MQFESWLEEKLELAWNRLDFVIRNGATIIPIGDPATKYALSWAFPGEDPGDWRETGAHDTYEEAIDEAIAVTERELNDDREKQAGPVPRGAGQDRGSGPESP